MWKAVISNDLAAVKTQLKKDNWFTVNSEDAGYPLTAKLITKSASFELTPDQVNIQSYQVDQLSANEITQNIAVELANNAYSDYAALSNSAKKFLNRNTLFAGIRWMQKGFPQTSRTLIGLVISNDGIKGWDMNNLFSILFRMYPDHKYTVSKLVYDWITARPRSLSDITLVLGDNIDQIFTIWTTMGSGPSPYQFRQIFKYGYTFTLEQRLQILKILAENGYDFNAKYISQTTNEPAYYSLANTYVGPLKKQFVKEIVDLILHGRLYLQNVSSGLFSSKKITSAINAFNYVWKTDITEICKKSGVDHYQKQAKKYRLEKLAYQLQLESDEVCSCIQKLQQGQTAGVVPYEDIAAERKKRDCDNEQTPFSLEDTTGFSDKQLYFYKVKRNNRKYCYDRSSRKRLLQKPVNPYTNEEFSEEFLDELAGNTDVKPDELSLEDAVKEITDHGRIAEKPIESDFQQVFQQLTNILSKINPYLDYEKWATQYSVKDYYKDNQDVGFDGFVEILDLSAIDITLPLQKYVTQLMAVILNRLDSAAVSPDAVVTAISIMLEYIKPSQAVEPTAVSEKSREELEAEKKELLKEFTAGGFKDQSLSQKIQEIRKQLELMEAS